MDSLPFKNVEDFVRHEGCLEWTDVSDLERTDVEVWIKENWLEPTNRMIARYRAGKSRNRGASAVLGAPYRHETTAYVSDPYGLLMGEEKTMSKYGDVHFWAKTAEGLQEQFHCCEHYDVSQDVADALSKACGIDTRPKSFVSDAGDVPIRIVPGTGIFKIKTNKGVFEF